LDETHSGDAGLGGAPAGEIDEGARQIHPDRLAAWRRGARQLDGQAAAAAADVADPLTRARIDGLQQVGRHRLCQALALRPRCHPSLVVPAPGLRLVGHGDTVTRRH
jgi:hypothetical protein